MEEYRCILSGTGQSNVPLIQAIAGCAGIFEKAIRTLKPNFLFYTSNMKIRSFTTLLLVLFSSVAVFSQQILSVTSSVQPPYDDMPKLIRDHLTGAGVEMLSVESNSDPYAIGFFTDGNSTLSIERVLILTTGYAEVATDLGNFWSSNGNSGDGIQLELQAIATDALNDVAYFRITFRPFRDSVRFRYVFGSEEYPEYACTAFNDVLGFFLSGPNPSGGNYIGQNIALIPGTNLSVSINNLHPANSSAFSPCSPFNAQFYHDNEGSNSQPIYDDYTDVFVAQARVVPCSVYEMVIAIADVGDSAYDSGVFLEAKSLQSEVDITSSLEIGNDVIPEIAIADTITFSFCPRDRW